jgi:glycosyltransferase involved in cell wall biosynthesis
MKKKLIWWECHLTDHQFYTIKALSDKFEITLISEKTNNKSRVKQGWKNSKYNVENIIYIKKYFKALRILIKNDECPIIFAGPFESWKTIFALIFSVFKKNEIYILTEPYSDTNEGLFNDNFIFFSYLKKKTRNFLYQLYSFLFFHKINAFFVISKKAYYQYLSLKVPECKLFPYCYFVPNINSNFKIEEYINSSNFKLVFVGNLSKRKGIDLLIEAIHELNVLNYNITLDIFGPGDFSKFDKNYSNITYKGVIPFGETSQVISKYNILIVPSRFDGWGVVVNEAIYAKVPVICSSNTGASGMIKMHNCGLIFNEVTVDKIKEALIKVLEAPNILIKWRDNLNILNNIITPNDGAEYIFKVINNIDVNKSQWYEV